MQEDDENVELWYLMAVAFNSLQPPDYESARCACGHVSTKSCVAVEFVGCRWPEAASSRLLSTHLWPRLRQGRFLLPVLAVGGPAIDE